MSLSLHIPWYFFFLAAVVLAALTIFVYRYTIPPVSSGKRTILTVLRSLALVLLFFAVIEPLLRYTYSSDVPPTVAVLVDNSLSMTLTDAAGNREAKLRSLLASSSLKNLSGKANVRYFTFSPALHPLNEISNDSLHLTGATTDIASALGQLRELALPHLQAVVLLSDGDYNDGANPLYEAERSPVPLFTAGIGDSSEQKDIAVEKVLTNSIAYVQSSVPVDATVRVSGFAGARTTASLLEDGKQVAQQILSFGSTSSGTVAEYPVHFSFTPTTTGVKKYTVRVAPLSGEVTEKNNARSFLVKVLKNKMQVTVAAAAPSADVAAVMQELHADPNIESQLFLQQINGELRNLATAKNFSSVLYSTECLVLLGMPSNTTTAATLQEIRSAAASRSLPVFFLSSRAIDPQKLSQWESFMPFTVNRNAPPPSRQDEQQVFPAIPPQIQSHVLVSVAGGENGSSGTDVWSKLPPIFSSFGTFVAKPEALVLATMRIQSVTLNNPLIVSRNVLQAKSFAVLGYGIWRWKLLAGASPETEKFFDNWFPAVIRWLVTREDNKRVQVVPSKEIFSQGEPIDFLGQVYNESYQPIENADIRVTVKSRTTQGQYETAMHSLGGGRYEGELDMLPEGEYSYSATAFGNGTAIGKDEGRFSVGEQSLEFSDTKMNKSLLQQMASVSGGAYADVSQFDQLVRKMQSRPSMKPEAQTTSSEFELWNKPWLLSLIVLLFGIEWFVRKRSGML
ncbi:MAG: hypothetical protein KGJ59_04645 [Bacteroidota bacterium]|nr:hypothetical protein [Bacteroidota bacterium]